MKKSLYRIILPALAAAAGLGFIACEDSDPVAPAGSTISLSASPDPINLLLGDTSTITARVLNQNGVPATDGTKVFFETSAGTLSVEETETADGQAITVLTVSGTGSATVKAFSGGVSASRAINAISGSVNTVTLASADPVIRLQCTDTVDLSGRVLDPSGAGIPGLVPQISVVSSSPTGLRGNATVSSTGCCTASCTDSGCYTATFLMVETDCTDNCDSGGVCTITVKATVLSKDSQQNVIISETVP